MPETMDLNEIPTVPTVHDKIPAKYSKIDNPPYKVNFRRNDTSDKSISSVHVGQILRKNGYIFHDVARNGRRLATVSFPTFETANKAIDDNELKKFYEIFIPNSFVFVYGYISNVDDSVEFDGDFGLISELKNSNAAITAVKPIFYTDRKDQQKKRSHKVSITFRAKLLPKYVLAFGVNLQVSPFINRVKLCSQCARFGHDATACKQITECKLCFKKTCVNPNECGTNTCKLCKSVDHKTGDSQHCPKFQEQSRIYKCMAVNNIGFNQARSQIVTHKNYFAGLENLNEFPEISSANSYANVMKTTPRNFHLSPLKHSHPLHQQKTSTVSPTERGAKAEQRDRMKRRAGDFDNPLHGPSFKIDLSHLQKDLSVLNQQEKDSFMDSITEYINIIIKKLIDSRPVSINNIASVPSSFDPKKQKTIQETSAAALEEDEEMES